MSAVSSRDRKLYESANVSLNPADSVICVRTLGIAGFHSRIVGMGFPSAAMWYVEGFGNRSGIATDMSLPPDLKRLPKDTETALFRILQEALTNVHRHSKSKSVAIQVALKNSSVVLTEQDAGKGIPKSVLQGFRSGGKNLGVGLAGIRERVKELGGTLEIDSTHSGTLIRATVPVITT